MFIHRQWAMPNKNTFDIKPIRDFVLKYWNNSETSIDPFARDKKLATYTNDLNPNTHAEYHYEAKEFLEMLIEKKVKADLIIFDPPYSLRQRKECYDDFGENGFTFEHSKNVGKWTAEKELCNKLLEPDGIFLHFGWHSNGLGNKYKCEIEEMLIVAHGGGHNDTICIAERKKGQVSRTRTRKVNQRQLFAESS